MFIFKGLFCSQKIFLNLDLGIAFIIFALYSSLNIVQKNNVS
jgi:hypothetical protein